MFFRRKRSGRTEYLHIVKNQRVDGQPRQSVVATLGRVDELAQDGTLPPTPPPRQKLRRKPRRRRANARTAPINTLI